MVFTAFSWNDLLTPAWIGAVTGLLALAVSGFVAFLQWRTRRELRSMQKMGFSGHVMGSKVTSKGQEQTAIGVLVRLKNDGHIAESLWSARIEYPDWITLSMTSAAKTEGTDRQSKMLQPADHAPFYLKFRGDGPLSLEFKPAKLIIEFSRSPPLQLDFQVGNPAFDVNLATGELLERKFKIAE